jgi:hypothetical protein
VQDVVLVLDGSVSLKKAAAELSESGSLFGREITVIIAGPEMKTFTTQGGKAFAEEVRRIKFSGGQDNLPALEAAWDLAATRGNGAILWLHGSQPHLLSSIEAFKQRFERRPNAVELFDLPMERAPNVVFAGLPAAARAQKVPMYRGPAEVLGELILEISGERPVVQSRRERLAAGAHVSGGESNLHLVRLWAADEIQRLLSEHREQKAVELAAKYQLVTDVSGAICEGRIEASGSVHNAERSGTRHMVCAVARPSSSGRPSQTAGDHSPLSSPFEPAWSAPGWWQCYTATS